MKICFKNLSSEMNETVKRLEKKLDFQVADDGIEIIVEKGDKLYIKYENSCGYIGYTETVTFFRMVTLFIKNIKKTDNFFLEEKTHFDTCGILLDMSRNAVLTVKSQKEYLDYLAMMGLNEVMLYLEDMYELEDYPYFGHLRGRYTKAELKEIDDYAYSYGISVFPHIQVLGHMERYLGVWRDALTVADTKHCLLAESEETYKLIDAMFKMLTESFRSNKIHIGMDETWDLGTGVYQAKHGLKNKTEIIFNHFEKVKEIAKKYSVDICMNCDMLFRAASENNSYTDTANLISDEKTKKYKELIGNATLFYWRYNSTNYDEYDKMIKAHQKLSDNIAFLGGTFTWHGFTNDLKNSFKRSSAALKACLDNKIRKVYCAQFGDGGAECDIFAALSGYQIYAEYMYHGDDNLWERAKENFDFITGASYDAYALMSDFHMIFDGRKYDKHFLTYLGKPIFYNDIMFCGFYKFIVEDGRTKHYKECLEKMKQFKTDKPFWQLRYDYGVKLFDYMAKKCEVTELLYPAYRDGDKTTLLEIADKHLVELYEKIKLLKDVHLKIWYTTNKAFGAEVLDIRYGGMLARTQTAVERVRMYLNGEIEKIEELEGERLLYSIKYISSYTHSATPASM